MKRQIDPNLNTDINEVDDISVGDKSLGSSIAPQEGELNLVGETDFAKPDPNYAVKESVHSDNIEDYQAGDHSKHRHHHHHSSSSSHSHHSSSGKHHHHHHHSSSSSHHSSHHHHHSKKKKKKPLIVRILIVLLLLIFIAVSVIGGTFLVLKQQGKKNLVVEPTKSVQTYDYVETIEYNGHKYVYDENKVALAFIGVDRDSLEADNIFGNSGQADADVVFVIDTVTGEISVINVVRDTMVDIDVYSASGKFMGVENKQLCLAYAYGDGGITSCTYTTKAISRILGNVPIEKYFALDLKGIAPLNDAVGGVTVTSLYNLKDYGIKVGDTVTLEGDAARAYVKTRDTDDVNASLNRTERQVQYIKGYSTQLLKAVKSDFKTVSNLYEISKTYSQTNITLSDITYLSTVILSNGVSDYKQYTLKGTMKPSSSSSDKVNAEYYVDEEALTEVVINCFYKEVN